MDKELTPAPLDISFTPLFPSHTRLLTPQASALLLTQTRWYPPGHDRRKARPGRYQRLVLFIKVLSLLCPNLTVASLGGRATVRAQRGVKGNKGEKDREPFFRPTEGSGR